MPDTPNRPFLRALKCAYKLHKAGLTSAETMLYLGEVLPLAEGGQPLPSASTPAADLLPASFNFHQSAVGADVWQAVQDRVFNSQKEVPPCC